MSFGSGLAMDLDDKWSGFDWVDNGGEGATFLNEGRREISS